MHPVSSIGIERVGCAEARRIPVRTDRIEPLVKSIIDIDRRSLGLHAIFQILVGDMVLLRLRAERVDRLCAAPQTQPFMEELARVLPV